MSERTFVCDLDPLGDGGWEVWIREQPYRGIDTDAALHQWERKRIGGSWSSAHFVVTAGSERRARTAAERAIREAHRAAVKDERESAEWRANATRERITITSDDVAAPEPTP